MYGGKTTLYEILGVSRDAKLTDLGRAYNKFRAEQQDETVAPDPPTRPVSRGTRFVRTWKPKPARLVAASL